MFLSIPLLSTLSLLHSFIPPSPLPLSSIPPLIVRISQIVRYRPFAAILGTAQPRLFRRQTPININLYYTVKSSQSSKSSQETRGRSDLVTVCLTETDSFIIDY